MTPDSQRTEPYELLPWNVGEPGKRILVVQESGQETLVSWLVTGDDHARIWNGITALGLDVSQVVAALFEICPSGQFAVALMNAGEANEAEIPHRIHDIDSRLDPTARRPQGEWSFSPDEVSLLGMGPCVAPCIGASQQCQDLLRVTDSKTS